MKYFAIAFGLVLAAAVTQAGLASAHPRPPAARNQPMSAQDQGTTPQQPAAPPQESRQEIILIYTFNPKVGVGADYQRLGPGWVEEIQLTTVGQEDVGDPNGSPGQKTTGYWVEQNSLDTGIIEKDLLVPVGADHTRMARIVLQRRDDTPEELPGQPPFPNLGEVAKQVGSNETVTTPAGTFRCAHFHSNTGDWDAWFSPQVTPFGLVRVVNADGSEMVVVRNLTGVKDHITGAPRRLDQAPAPKADSGSQ